jgi:hypothetical protein
MSVLKLADFDAIVIGAGPAGLAAVNQLIHEGKKSILINATTANGYGIGGLANEWHNQCAELEEVDFEGLDNFSSWPISYSEYRKYTEKAKKLFDIEINKNNEASSRRRYLSQDDIFIDEVETIISKKQSWEQLFLSTLQNPLLTIHNGIVSRIIHNNHLINSLVLDGKEQVVNKASKIYLAAGCIGNTEILSRSNFLELNKSSTYSKYLADHPMFENIYLRGGRRNSFQELFERKKVNNKFLLRKKKYRVRKNGKNLGVFEIRHFFTNRSIDNNTSHLLFNEYIKLSINKFNNILFKRIVFRPLQTKVWIQLAQELNPESQIYVKEKSTHISWKLNEKDLENYFEIIKTIKFLTKENGFSLHYAREIETVKDLESTVLPAFHLSGTTRMSKLETDSVVDKNCKLLNIENCYILGSSVFTTPGWVNPTLSIMALSIRTVEKSWRN